MDAGCGCRSRLTSVLALGNLHFSALGALGECTLLPPRRQLSGPLGHPKTEGAAPGRGRWSYITKMAEDLCEDNGRRRDSGELDDLRVDISRAPRRPGV